MSGYIDTKFINMLSPRLERFKWKKQGLAVCRCPVCGDSEKVKSKTRFYIYERGGNHFCKCHNCGFSSLFGTLLRKMDEALYRQYRMETLKEGSSVLTPTHARTHAPAPARTREKPKDELLTLLPSLDTLPKDHPAVRWAESRRLPVTAMSLLYYSDNYGEWATRVDPDVKAGDDPRIVIPIINKDGKLTGSQGRILPKLAVSEGQKPNRSVIRYLTIKADKDGPKQWYGMDRCDPNQPVFVVEGPLDSLFLPNCVAMVGLSDALSIPPELKDSKLIYALDNEPRNAEVVESMEELLDAGHHVCVWSDKMRGMKDINDMVLSGMSASTIAREIERNSHVGLSGMVALKRWAK
jgi:hypothetical protein